MANVLDDSILQKWSRSVQVFAKQNMLARQIVSFGEQAGLQEGDRVHRPIFTDPAEGAVSSTGVYAPTDITDSKESLIVDQWRHASVFINEKNLRQMSYNFMVEMTKRAGERLGRRLDRVILGEYSNATLNTTATQFNISNVTQNVLDAKAQLIDEQCETDRPWFWITDSELDTLVTEHKIANGFNISDTILGGVNLGGETIGGIMSQPFLKLKTMISNSALTWTGEVAMATNPTNTDTLTITKGNRTLTCTFVSSIGSTPGNILIAGTVDGTRANLEAFINDPFTTSANQVGLTAGSDAAKVLTDGGQTTSEVLVAGSNNDTTDVLTLTSTKGRLTLGHTLTASADGVQNMILHTLMGKIGAIDLVFQKDFASREKEVNRTLGIDIVTDGLYGYKTFSDGARCLVDVRVTTQSDSLTA